MLNIDIFERKKFAGYANIPISFQSDSFFAFMGRFPTTYFLKMYFKRNWSCEVDDQIKLNRRAHKSCWRRKNCMYNILAIQGKPSNIRPRPWRDATENGEITQYKWMIRLKKEEFAENAWTKIWLIFFDTDLLGYRYIYCISVRCKVVFNIMLAGHKIIMTRGLFARYIA